jgi:phytanoyl-CoA hydroxylase
MDTLGYKNPVIPQSMYIFKQPFVGSEVTSHQDSTFLFTYPKQTCLGLWLALDDSTVVSFYFFSCNLFQFIIFISIPLNRCSLCSQNKENGCLWVRPGSQTEPLRRKFVRNPEYFNSNENLDKTQKPLMIFENLVDEADAAKAPWEGSLPNVSWPPPCAGLFESGFVPVECKAGDLVVFSGKI